MTCICAWIWKGMENLKAVLGERLLQQVDEAINSIFNVWPRSMLGLLVDLVVGTLQIVLPGSNFGSDATFLHSVGPVATFLSGCSSGAFFLALVPGFIAGIGFSMLFSQYMQHRALARQRKAVCVAAMSSLTLDSVHQLLPKDLYPNWLVFPELEKVAWLNQCLKKIWPFFNEAYSISLMESWEPYLDFYKPTIATSVNFAKLTLGTVAPEIKGVCMLETMDGEITLEMETQWEGNCSCILSVGLPMGISLPAEVKDVKMSLVLRILVKPLVDELPCFGAFTYSIRKKKRFDFTLKFIGEELAAIPGLSGLAMKLQDMIRVAVIDSLCWPMRVVIPIIRDPVDGDYTKMQRHLCPRRNAVDFKLGFPQQPAVGVVDIRLAQGRDLRRNNTLRAPDAFALLFIHPVPGLMRRSTTIVKQLNPIWNEFFELEVEDPSEQKVIVYVIDEAAAQEFQLLGCTHIALQGLESGKIKGEWLKLYKTLAGLQQLESTKERGRIHVEIAYRCYDQTRALRLQNSHEHNQEEPCIHRESSSNPHLDTRYSRRGPLWEVRRGVLTVTVVQAENLLPSDFNGKADPYVVLRMYRSFHHKKETKVINGNLNPIWNESFHFLVEDAVQDMLMAQVWDKDTFGKDYMGMCATTLTKALQEQEVSVICRLVGVDIGRLYLQLKWSSLS